MRSVRVLAVASALVAASAASSGAQLPKLQPECFDRPATIVGTEGDDVLTGTPGNDTIAALEGDDVLHGMGGNDSICGGAGADEIDGGSGRDAIAVGRGADVAEGRGGFDILVEFSSDRCGPCNPVDVESRDESVDHIFGGPGPDVLNAEGGNDVVDGGRGGDLVMHLGRFTATTIDLTAGTAVSSAGDVDELRNVEHAAGSVFSDRLRGDEGGNHLFGMRSDDHVVGEDGPDVLFTNSSASTLVGGFDEAPDVLRVSLLEPMTIDLAAGVSVSRETAHLHAPDVVAGFEHVLGGPYDDAIFGDEASNVLEGGFGHDTLDARGGDDYLFGDYARPQPIYWAGTTPGNDRLDGGAGRDRLDGGPLVDECVNGERYVSCEDTDAPSSREAVRSTPGVPWWWEHYDVAYLQDSLGLTTTLTMLGQTGEGLGPR